MTDNYFPPDDGPAAPGRNAVRRRGKPQTITKGEKKMTEMFKYKTSFPLKQGFSLWLEDMENTDCSNGNYHEYEIRDSEGHVVQSGLTCRCGRGCANTDCIRDDWGDHDTDIEKFREF